MTTIINGIEFINLEDGKFECKCGSIISNKQSLYRHLDTIKHKKYINTVVVKEEVVKEEVVKEEVVKEEVKEEIKIDFNKFTIDELMYDINKHFAKEGQTLTRKKLPKPMCLKLIEKYNINKHYTKEDKLLIEENNKKLEDNIVLITRYNMAENSNIYKGCVIDMNLEESEELINKYKIREYDFTTYEEEKKLKLKKFNEIQDNIRLIEKYNEAEKTKIYHGKYFDLTLEKSEELINEYKIREYDFTKYEEERNIERNKLLHMIKYIDIIEAYCLMEKIKNRYTNNDNTFEELKSIIIDNGIINYDFSKYQLYQALNYYKRLNPLVKEEDLTYLEGNYMYSYKGINYDNIIPKIELDINEDYLIKKK